MELVPGTRPTQYHGSIQLSIHRRGNKCSCPFIYNKRSLTWSSGRSGSPQGSLILTRQASNPFQLRNGLHIAAMGTRKGCYQCTKRRIFCDQTEPQCLKCAAKGLECSGNGLRYRFNDGIASRGKFRGQTTPAAQTCTWRASQRKQTPRTMQNASCLSAKTVQRANQAFDSPVAHCPQAMNSFTRAMMDFCKFQSLPGARQ